MFPYAQKVNKKCCIDCQIHISLKQTWNESIWLFNILFNWLSDEPQMNKVRDLPIRKHCYFSVSSVRKIIFIEKWVKYKLNNIKFPLYK